MTSTAILTEDSTTIVADTARYFHWGAVIAGAIAAMAVTLFLLTLGSGVPGLGVVSVPQAGAGGAAAFLTLAAIYVFAAQAFGFTVGGYLVGRLIGPEVETAREEEFRAAAHGFVMWGIAVVASLMIAGFSSVFAGSVATGAMAASRAPAAAISGYWLDLLFRPAGNSVQVAADKAEAGRIWAMNMPRGGAPDDADTIRIAHLVAQDAGLNMAAAMTRVSDVQARMHQNAVRTADMARHAASILSLWAAFALLFGAILAVAAAISARWMDDKVSFSFQRRAR